MKTLIIILLTCYLIIGCSCYKGLKSIYDKRFHDNQIEEKIEQIIKDTTDIDIDISTEDEKKPELC